MKYLQLTGKCLFEYEPGHAVGEVIKALVRIGNKYYEVAYKLASEAKVLCTLECTVDIEPGGPGCRDALREYCSRPHYAGALPPDVTPILRRIIVGEIERRGDIPKVLDLDIDVPSELRRYNYAAMASSIFSSTNFMADIQEIGEKYGGCTVIAKTSGSCRNPHCRFKARLILVGKEELSACSGEVRGVDAFQLFVWACPQCRRDPRLSKYAVGCVLHESGGRKFIVCLVSGSAVTKYTVLVRGASCEKVREAVRGVVGAYTGSREPRVIVERAVEEYLRSGRQMVTVNVRLRGIPPCSYIMAFVDSIKYCLEIVTDVNATLKVVEVEPETATSKGGGQEGGQPQPQQEAHRQAQARQPQPQREASAPQQAGARATRSQPTRARSQPVAAAAEQPQPVRARVVQSAEASTLASIGASALAGALVILAALVLSRRQRA